MLWQLSRNIPFYLLFSSISLSTQALPVQSSELTPETFNSTIAKGVWLIEHFSPYCSHCRYFAPTWEELVKENEAEENPGIRLRQINCVAHGDLCNENGVSGYPQLQVYRDGELIEQFKQARDKEILQEFMKKHARPESDTKKAEEKKPEQEQAADEKKEDKKVEEKKVEEKKSEPVVEHPPVRPPINTKGQVLVLDPTNFHHAVAKGPVFIKFYAPWCGHCKKLAPVWTELAHYFKDKLEIAQVDCEAHSALCTSQGIQGFPTLVYFAGDSKTEYNGGRKLEQLKSFAEKASGEPVKAVTVDELKKHVEESDVVYALLHSSSQHGLVTALTPAFLPLLGSPAVLTVQDPPQSLLSLFNIKSSSSEWHLVAIKDHDLDTPASVFSSHLSPEALTDAAHREPVSKWLTANRLPTTAELTRDTFQSIMNAPSRPLVVIVSVTEDNAFVAKEKIQEVARSWRLRSGGSGVAKGTRGERPVVFAWMDVEKWKDWMKSMYGVRPKKTNDLEELDVVVADHQELIYYNADLSGEKIRLTSSASLFSAIEGVVNGKTPYLHSENFVERLARYLNKKVTAVEQYVVNNPIHTLFLLAGVSGVIILVIRRVIKDDAQELSDYERKGGRLD